MTRSILSRKHILAALCWYLYATKRKTDRSLVILFSKQEIEQIRRFFDQVRSGDSLAQATDLAPVENTVFLLLRKLLAYGFYYVPQTNPAISYQALQQITTKPHKMLSAVRTYPDEFDQLLAAYTRSQE